MLEKDTSHFTPYTLHFTPCISCFDVKCKDATLVIFCRTFFKGNLYNRAISTGIESYNLTNSTANPYLITYVEVYFHAYFRLFTFSGLSIHKILPILIYHNLYEISTFSMYICLKTVIIQANANKAKG